MERQSGLILRQTGIFPVELTGRTRDPHTARSGQEPVTRHDNRDFGL